MSKLEISWSSLWRVFFMLVLVVVLYFLRNVLLILFLALVISAAFDAPISFLERKKVPRILGALMIFFLTLAVFALLLYTIIPIAIAELANFLGRLGNLDLPVLGTLGVPQLLQKIEANVGNLNDLTGLLFSGGASVIEVASAIFGGLFFIITVFVLSLYLAISRDGVEKFLRAVLPLSHEEYTVDLYLRVKRKMGLWLRGQLILSSIVGLVVFIGLWILGVDYALIIGVIAAILEIVPYVGPVFAGALAFLLAAPQSLITGIYVIILFIVVQQIESHLLIPTVMKKTVGIHPVVAVISLLAGAQLAGLPGAILSVPTAVILQELIEDYASRKRKSRLI